MLIKMHRQCKMITFIMKNEKFPEMYRPVFQVDDVTLKSKVSHIICFSSSLSFLCIQEPNH